MALWHLIADSPQQNYNVSANAAGLPKAPCSVGPT